MKKVPQGVIEDGIVELKSGRFQVDLREKGYKRVRKSFPTKKMAQNWKALTVKAMEDGTYRSAAELKAEAELEAQGLAGVMTLRTATQKYLDDVTSKKTKKSIEFETSVMKMLRTMPFINLPMHEITPSHIEDFSRYLSDTRNNVQASVNRKLTVIVHLFNKATKWHIKELENKANPATGIKQSLGVRGGRRSRKFRGDEEEILMTALKQMSAGSNPCDPYIEPIFILAVETGMRRREILENVWTNVTFGERPMIHIHEEIAKSRAERDCPLSPRAVAALKTLRKLSGGKGFLADIELEGFKSAWQRVQAAAKKEGLTNFQFRDSRHIALTRLSKIYPRAQDLARISGHEKLDTLLIYYEDDIEEQCDIMKTYYDSK